LVNLLVKVDVPTVRSETRQRIAEIVCLLDEQTVLNLAATVVRAAEEKERAARSGLDVRYGADVEGLLNALKRDDSFLVGYHAGNCRGFLPTLIQDCLSPPLRGML